MNTTIKNLCEDCTRDACLLEEKGVFMKECEFYIPPKPKKPSYEIVFTTADDEQGVCELVEKFGAENIISINSRVIGKSTVSSAVFTEYIVFL